MCKYIIFSPLILIFCFIFLDRPQRYRLIIASKQVEVIDGDTIRIRPNGLKVRLFGIDAPELSQLSFDKKPIGLYAKTFLTNLVGEKPIEIEITGKGYYGRSIGLIYNKGRKTSFNYLMVSQGYSVLFSRSRYSSRRQKRIWQDAFSYAYINRLGLWKTKGFYSPKTYRKKVRALNQ